MGRIVFRHTTSFTDRRPYNVAPARQVSSTRLSLIIITAAATLAGCGGGKSSPTSPTTSSTPPATASPAPTPPATPTPPPVPGALPLSRYTWLGEGVRLESTSLGFSGAFADTTTIRLADGRYRMYVFANGRYRSAISPDGLTFTMETTLRLGSGEFPEGYGQMRVIRTLDGRIRAFNLRGDNIVSSVSSDEGVTFEAEPGVRLSGSAVGFRPSGVSIVQMSGVYRMYFSSLPPQPNPSFLPSLIRSAWSVDTLTWTLDEGVRIGTGARLDGSAQHPGAIANSDGSVSLFYLRNTPGPNALKMLMATAPDGLTFTEEFDTGITQANDPDLVALPGGSVRMYYNWGNDSFGRISSAIYSGAPFAASIAASPSALVPAGITGNGQSLPSRFGARRGRPE